jgi:hypothetical protein
VAAKTKVDLKVTVTAPGGWNNSNVKTPAFQGAVQQAIASSANVNPSDVTIFGIYFCPGDPSCPARRIRRLLQATNFSYLFVKFEVKSTQAVADTLNLNLKTSPSSSFFTQLVQSVISEVTAATNLTAPAGAAAQPPVVTTIAAPTAAPVNASPGLPPGIQALIIVCVLIGVVIGGGIGYKFCCKGSKKRDSPSMDTFQDIELRENPYD